MSRKLFTMASGALALALITLTAGLAHAQAEHYQPIRVDSGVSGTYLGSTGSGGFGGVVEPKFLVTDQIGVGARLEGAVLFGGSIDGGGDVDMNMAAVAAVLAKGEYLFFDGGVRPFVGFGLGFYDIASQGVGAGSATTQVSQKAGRYFGVAPEIGVDLGRVRLAATYNAILGADVEVTQNVGGAEQTASYSQNYFTVELTFRFGGNRRPASVQPPAVARN